MTEPSAESSVVAHELPATDAPGPAGSERDKIETPSVPVTEPVAAAEPASHARDSVPQASPRRTAIVWLGLLVVISVVGGGLWLATRPGPDVIQGMAEADTINVSAKITARVARLLVSEGSVVTPGQALFELDSPEVAARRRQTGSVLEAARAQQSKAEEGAREEEIRAAEANLHRAEAAADLAQSTQRRTDVLFKEGVVTRQRYEEALAQSRSAAESVAAARAQYDQALAGARRQDRQAAHAQVRQAEGALAEVAVAEDEITGRAPTSGEINKRMADVGELVPAGYPIFSLIDPRRTWIALYVREDQFRGVRMGRVLRADVPALHLSGVEFEVYFINPAGDFATWRATRQSSGYDVKTFEVRARPRGPIPDMRPGMSVLFPWPQ